MSFVSQRSKDYVKGASIKDVPMRGGYHNGDIVETLGRGVKVNKDIPKAQNFFNYNLPFLPPTPYLFFKCIESEEVITMGDRV